MGTFFTISKSARGAAGSTQLLNSTASRYNEHRVQPLAGTAIAAIRVTKIDLADQGTCLYFKDRVQPEASRALAAWRIVRLFPESYQTVMGAISSCVCDMIRIRFMSIGARINSYSTYFYPWLLIIFHAASTIASTSKYILDIVHLISRITADCYSSSTQELTMLDIHRLLYPIYTAVCTLSADKLLRVVMLEGAEANAISSYTHDRLLLMRNGRLIIRILSWLYTLKNLKAGQIVILEDPYI